MPLLQLMRRFSRISIRLLLLCLTLALGVSPAKVAFATAEADALGAACMNALGIVGCNNLGRPPSGPREPVFTGTWYAAIAKSTSSTKWGASWRESSQVSAERDAIKSCAATGDRSCKVIIVGANNCMSLAISEPDGAWGVADSYADRSTAVSKATNICRKYGGRKCSVVVTPCGRQDKSAPACIKQYPIDISRGEAWQHMSAEEKALWTKRANGACK